MEGRDGMRGVRRGERHRQRGREGKREEEVRECRERGGVEHKTMGGVDKVDSQNLFFPQSRNSTTRGRSFKVRGTKFKGYVRAIKTLGTGTWIAGLGGYGPNAGRRD